MPGILALFVAMRIEERLLRPFLQGAENRVVGERTLFLGRNGPASLLLCRTGIGRRAAETAGAVFGSYRLEGALSLGFAGGVTEALRPGHLHIAQATSLCEEGLEGASVACNPRLLEMAEVAARRAGLRWQRGVSGTVVDVLATPAAKRRAADQWGVDIVQMEDYWVGREAQARGIPYLAVRAVLDGADARLPIGIISARGSLRLRRAVISLARDPLATLGLLYQTRAASRSLRRFFAHFLTVWTGGEA